MISIRNSLSELEKCHQERMAAVGCYQTAIRNVARYTIELDPSITEPQRAYLNRLAEEVGENPSSLAESGATFRGLLRDYRDKATTYLKKLYEELGSTTLALEQILGTMSQSDGDHEKRLRDCLGRLREIAKSPEGAAVQVALLASVDDIGREMESMRQQHRLTVSQFQVEIGVLHKRIDQLEAAASVDRLTELLNRREMEDRILSAEPGSTVLLVRVNGFRTADLQFGKDVTLDLIGAFTKRLRNTLPARAILGRWGNEEFVTILSLSQREATVLARSISEQLSGTYSCLREGKTVRPSLQLTVAVVDSEGIAPDRVLDRVRSFLVGSAAV